MADEGGEIRSSAPPEASDGGADALDVDLDELDDAEFEIPAVATPPSLESILNEQDDHSDAEELGLIAEQDAETTSVASRGSSEGRRGRGRRPSPSGNRASNNSIVRHVLLKGLTTQINSASERVGAGSASCACAGSGTVCVGTSQGLVLVFDSAQALRWCLNEGAGAEAGAVSALGLSACATRLLVGHARGAVFMFDLGSGKLLRTLSEAHPPATAVLHLKFTEGTSCAVLADAGGSVFELSFTRSVLGARGWGCRCLFSGSRGEVVAVEPLAAWPQQLLAMATLSKAIVVQLRPRTRVLFSHPLPSTAPSLPLLAWQRVVIQVADGRRVLDPVLAFGRLDTFFFYQVSMDGGGRTRLVPLQRTRVSYHMLSLQWLNPRTLAVLDTKEQLHVLDVRTQTELEVIELSEVRLVYASSHFKGLATGGNVSPALAAAGERACYHSVVACGQQLLVLGTRSVHALSVRPWTERVAHLVRQRRFLAALDLCLAIHDDRAKAVVGLKGPKPHRKQLVKKKLFEVLENFVEAMLSKEASDQELQEVWTTAANLCFQLDQMDLLLGGLHEAAVGGGGRAEAAYLEALQPLILNEQLRQPPPALLQRLVNHLEGRGQLQALEACLVRVDVGCLDVHQAMKLCWQHNLYDAIIYVHTSGMQDFETPFTDLATVLQNALATGKQLSEEVVRLGNVLLVFASCCLAGRAYPHGDIPLELQPQAKHQLLKSLTAVHSRNAPDSELPHPYLRALLQFDTREFLNVLALAFEEPEFTSELGLRQRQRIVDILLQLMVLEHGFSACQVGALFTFLARQLARPGSALVVEPALFTQVIDFLTTPDASVSAAQHDERQQALLELLRATADLHPLPPPQLLSKAREAKFFRVCELLLERERDYEPILECYLLDPLRRQQAFNFLRNVLGNQGYLAPDRAHHLLVQNIKDLVELDKKKTGQLMLCHAAAMVPQAMEALEPHPQTQLDFLQGLFLYREGHSKGDEIPVEAHERLLQLLCQLQPDAVAAHLAAGHGCRLDNALEICRSSGHVEGEMALLEQKGDVGGAFALLCKQLTLELEAAEAADAAPDAWERASTRLGAGVRLCQRGGGALLDQAARQALFFPLLRTLAQRRAAPHLNPDQQQAYGGMCAQVLSGMVGYVALPAALQLLLEEPALAHGRFGELKHLLLSMLASAAEEERLLAATRRLLGADLHKRLNAQLRGARRPLAPHPAGAPVPASAPPLCAHCDRALNAAPPAFVFRCGHAFHCSCAPVGSGDPECPLCQPGPRAAPDAAPSKMESNRVEAGWRRQRAAPSTAASDDPLVLNLSPPPGHAFLQGLF